MAFYYGKDAFVTGLTNVQSWTASNSVTSARHSHSGIAGGTDSPSGVQNWTGSISGVGHQPGALFPGYTDVAFVGTMKNTATKITMEGNILVESLTLDINRSTQAPISWSATFGFQGTPTNGAVNGAAQAGFYEAENGKNLGITLDGSAAGWANIQSTQLVFRRPHSTYVDAGTTHRTAGNLECDISVSVLDANVAVVAANSVDVVKVNTTAVPAFWEIDSIRWLGITGLTVDRNGTPIGYTIAGQWTGVQGTTEGHIKGPDLTYYFGS